MGILFGASGKTETIRRLEKQLAEKTANALDLEKELRACLNGNKESVAQTTQIQNMSNTLQNKQREIKILKERIERESATESSTTAAPTTTNYQMSPTV